MFVSFSCVCVSLTHHVPAGIKQVCLVWPCFHQWSYQGTDCHCPPRYQQSKQLCHLLPPHFGPFVQKSNFWNTEIQKEVSHKLKNCKLIDSVIVYDWFIQSLMCFTGNVMYLISKIFPNVFNTGRNSIVSTANSEWLKQLYNQTLMSMTLDTEHRFNLHLTTCITLDYWSWVNI